MPEKLKVFVAHSFDEKIPEGEDKSDIEVAERFIKLMIKNGFHPRLCFVNVRALWGSISIQLN